MVHRVRHGQGTHSVEATMARWGAVHRISGVRAAIYSMAHIFGAWKSGDERWFRGVSSSKWSSDGGPEALLVTDLIQEDDDRFALAGHRPREPAFDALEVAPGKLHRIVLPLACQADVLQFD